MKFIITENKVDSVIYKYLTDVYTPDYSWGPEFFDFYKTAVKNHKYIEFFINNIPEFTYYDAAWIKKALQIDNKMVLELNDLFGQYWAIPFVKWFEDNTNLEVRIVTTRQNDEIHYMKK